MLVLFKSVPLATNIIPTGVEILAAKYLNVPSTVTRSTGYFQTHELYVPVGNLYQMYNG